MIRTLLIPALALAVCLPMKATVAPSPEPMSASQAAVTIQGTVFDENNEPVIGANVASKTNKGIAVNTDFAGNFRLQVAPRTPLVISYVGYKTVTVAASDGMQVYLQPTTEQLDQLVVIGYGTQKKANLTGAVATVDVPRVMDNRPQTDVMKALQGAVPGLTITTLNGDIDASATFKIRGTGTLTNNQESAPLVVVDGVPVDDLSFLNPSDIQDISVLKDAASASIYGTRAAFGVILITTKEPNNKDRVSIKYSNNFAWSQATTLPEYSSVPNQIRALMQTNNRQGVDNELFGMYLDKMLPYAEAWEQQNNGPRKYGEMRPFKSWDDVGDYYVNEDGSGAMYYANWDVKGIMFNNAAPSNKHNVSLEGTSGKTQYRLAFGYDHKQGLMTYNPDQLKRYTVNASISTEVFKWLKAGARFNWADKRYTYPNIGRNTYTYMWRWGSYFGPYGYSYDADGNKVDYRNDIAYRKQAGDVKNTSTQTRMQGWLQAQIIKGLTLQADFTYNVVNFNEVYAYLPVYCYNSWGGNISSPTYVVGQSSTTATQGNSKDDLWTTNIYATYDHTFVQGHNLKVMLGFTAEKEDYNYFSVRRNVLMDNNLPYLGLTSGDTYTTSNTITHRATTGFFGRINYDYKGIYLLELNGRYDGSSRFPANDQWAFFPSGSAGYRFSEESYFKKIKDTNIWTNGKVRVSYGQVGNEAVGTNRFLSTVSQVSAGSVHWINSGGQKITEYSMPTLVSSSLTWERIITTDVGLDLGFLNNSLNLTFDWFQRDTHDMLAQSQELPNTLGATSPYTNAGRLRTRGWELGISWNHSFGEWDVYANFNIADAKTKITKWANKSNLYSWSPGQTLFCEGGYYGDIWGFETDRYFEESDFVGKNADGSWIYAEGVAEQTALQTGKFVFGPGDIKFVDQNGDGHINGGDGTVENHGDLKVIGNTQPRYEYSFRLGAAWHGFDIDCYFQGVGKRHMWSPSAFVMPFTRGADATYSHQDSYNQMIFDDENNIIGYIIDQNNKYPCMYAGGSGNGVYSSVTGSGCFNFYPQTKYLMNMAYLRFKTLTVGYTLPANISMKAYIQTARVYFTAENLCFLYNGMHDYPIDPEIAMGGSGTKTSWGDASGSGTFGRATPMPRSFSFGIQVTI